MQRRRAEHEGDEPEDEADGVFDDDEPDFEGLGEELTPESELDRLWLDEEPGLEEEELGDAVLSPEPAEVSSGLAEDLGDELGDATITACDGPDVGLLPPDSSAQAWPLIPSVTNAAVAVPMTPAASRRARASMWSPPMGFPTWRPVVPGRVPGQEATKRRKFWKRPIRNGDDACKSGTLGHDRSREAQG